MTIKLFVLILFSVGLSALAQISLKLGMSGNDIHATMRRAPPLAELFIAILSDWRVLMGLALYGVGALLWLLVLAKIDVSAAYPFVGLGFIFTALLGHFMLGEQMGFQRIAGTMFVLGGVFLVARST